MPFRLRHQQHNFELTPGDFLVGRSGECQLSLDDPLVSRKHAVLIVAEDSVTIKDLGSRNGIIVNGARVEGSRKLADGDQIVIGSQEMTLLSSKKNADTPDAVRRRIGTQTLSVLRAVQRRPTIEQPKEATAKRLESLSLLSTLADKALALGRPDDAERILGFTLQDVLRCIREGRPTTNETVELAGQYALRLATATGKGAWVDYVIALYTQLRRPCPATIVDELHVVLRKVASIDLPALRHYLETLRDNTSVYGPADRFLVQRIESLVQLAALR